MCYAIYSGVIILKITDIKKDDFCVCKIICMAQRWENHTSWSYLNAERPDHGFYMIIRGRCEYTMKNGEKIIGKKGDIMYIPKGINYEVYFDNTEDDVSEPQVNAYLVNFILTDENGEETALSESIKCVYSGKVGYFAEQFKNMIELYRQNRRIYIKSMFYEILSKISQQLNEDETGIISEGIKYIENNFNSSVSIGELAKMCAVSETSFRRLFKKTTGESPVRYINNLKISKAKELLKSSEITVEEISDFLSFYDKAYFCRTFKALAGLTPSEYRKKYLYHY